MQDSRNFKLISYPRVHCCLVDLCGVTRRKYGGMGFSVDGESVQIYATKSQRLACTDFEILDISARSAIQRMIKRFRKIDRDIFGTYQLVQSPNQHSGFGTTTAVLLGLAKVISLINDLELSDLELQMISGRGGASGIGIRTFFTGGLVVDTGHRLDSNRKYLPSSASTPSNIPPVSVRLEFPKNWRIVLVLTDGNRVFGDEESAFFRRNTPIPKEEVYRVLAEVYHGVIPAVLERDILGLKEALIALHETGFKARELSVQPESVHFLLSKFKGLEKVASGMSSLGPLVYGIYDSACSDVEEIRSVCAGAGGRWLGSFPANNSGFKLVYD